MPENDKIKALYDAGSQHFDLGSYEEFNKKIEAPEKRKALYESLSEHLDLGSYDEYETKLKKKEQTVSQDSGEDSKQPTTSGKTTAIDPTTLPKYKADERSLDIQKATQAKENPLEIDYLKVDEERVAKEQELKKKEKEREDYLKSLDNGISKPVSAIGSFNKAVANLPANALEVVSAVETKMEDVIAPIFGLQPTQYKDQPLTVLAEKYKDLISNTVGQENPAYQEELQTQVSTALGDLATLYATGGAGLATESMKILEYGQKVNRLSGITGALKQFVEPPAVTAMIQVGASEYQQAKEAGATDDEAFNQMIVNIPVSSILEKLPVQNFFKRLDGVSKGGFKEVLNRGRVGGLEEMSTEVIEQMFSNVTAGQIYDETRNVMDGVGEAGSIGFGLGFVINALGGKLKQRREETTDPAEIQEIDKSLEYIEEKANELKPSNQTPESSQPVNGESVSEQTAGDSGEITEVQNPTEDLQGSAEQTIEQRDDFMDAAEDEGPSAKIETAKDLAETIQAQVENETIIAEEKVSKVAQNALSDNSKLSEEEKELLKTKNITYNPQSVKMTREEADNIVTTLGHDRALNLYKNSMAESSDFVKGALGASLIKSFDGKIQEAVTSEEKLALRNEKINIIEQAASSITEAAQKTSVLGKLYKELLTNDPASMVLAVQKQYRKNADKLLAPEEEAINQTFNDFNKIKEEIISEFVSSDDFRKVVQDAVKKTKSKSRQVKVKSFFDGLRIKGEEGEVYDVTYLLGRKVYNGAIDVIEQAVLTGLSVADAVKVGVDYIKSNNKDQSWDEESFRADLINKLESLDQEVLVKENIKSEFKSFNVLLDEVFPKKERVKVENKLPSLNEIITKIAKEDPKVAEVSKNELLTKINNISGLTPELAAKLKEGLDKAIEKKRDIQKAKDAVKTAREEVKQAERAVKKAEKATIKQAKEEEKAAKKKLRDAEKYAEDLANNRGIDKDTRDKISENFSGIDVLTKPEKTAPVGGDLPSLSKIIAEIAKDNSVIGSAKKQDLVNRIVKAAGLDPEVSSEIAAKINESVEKAIAGKKEKILAQTGKKKISKKAAASLMDKAINLSNLGALTNEKFRDLYAEAMGIPSLNDSDKQKILNLSEKIQAAERAKEAYKKDFTAENKAKHETLVKEADKANKELSEYLNKKRTTWDTLSVIMQGNLLTPLSIVANLTSNTALQGMNLTSQGIASALDYMISKAPGQQRTMRFFPAVKGSIKGIQLGVKEGTSQLKTGASNFDLEKRELSSTFDPVKAFFKFGDIVKGKEKANLEETVNTFFEGTFGLPAEAMFRLLNLGDKPFRRMAEMGKAYELGALKGLKGPDLDRFVAFPDEASAKIIEESGDKATLQEDGEITKITQQFLGGISNLLGRVPVIGGPLQLVLKSQIPFVKTPLNVIKNTLRFALPEVSLGMSMYQWSKGNRQQALNHFGDAVVGMMIVGAAKVLIDAALVSAGPEDDDKGKGIQYDTVKPKTLNVEAMIRGIFNGGDFTVKPETDTMIDYSRFGGPFSVILNLYADLKNEDPDFSFLTSRVQLLPSVAKSSLEQSFLKGSYALLDAFMQGGDKIDRWLINTTSALGSIVLPNTVAAVSRATNENMVNTKDDDLKQEFINTFKNKVFMGNSLPAKVSIWGEPVKQTPEGRNAVIYNLLDITKIQDMNADKFSYQIYELWKKTKDNDVLPSVVGDKIKGNKLTPKQVEEYQILAGQARKRLVQHVVTSTNWDNISSDEKKMDKLKDLYRKGLKIGQTTMIKNHPELRKKRIN